VYGVHLVFSKEVYAVHPQPAYEENR
jgi:hypothetical protein